MRSTEEVLSETVALLVAHAKSRGVRVTVTRQPDGTQRDYIERALMLSRSLLYGWDTVTLP